MIKLFLIAQFFFSDVNLLMKSNNDPYLKNEIAICYFTKIDSFNYYYRILDSVKKIPYDSSTICIKAVRFMEKLTGIKAHANGDYFGWHYFIGLDLIEWKKWYKKHK